jgi:hypothetical protein
LRHIPDLSIIKGFQLAKAKGFLCADPVDDVAFVIEKWSINTIVDNENNDEQQETSGINNTDSVTTTTTINPVDEIESLPRTMITTVVTVQNRHVYYRLPQSTRCKWPI